MTFKIIFFLVASFLLITSKVSSNEEESYLQAAFFKPPVKGAPAPAPFTKPPVKGAPAPAPCPKVLPPVRLDACPGLCQVRCSKHSMPDHCMRVCMTCCHRCKCVPPGTYGNKEMCGKCYVEMTTHGGRPKCP